MRWCVGSVCTEAIMQDLIDLVTGWNAARMIAAATPASSRSVKDWETNARMAEPIIADDPNENHFTAFALEVVLARIGDPSTLKPKTLRTTALSGQRTALEHADATMI